MQTLLNEMFVLCLRERGVFNTVIFMKEVKPTDTASPIKALLTQTFGENNIRAGLQIPMIYSASRLNPANF